MAVNDVEDMAIAIGSRMDGDVLAATQAQAQEVERVFIAWVESETRKAADVAEATGVPVARVRKYIREGGFQERYAHATERFRKAAAPYSQTRAIELVDDVVTRLASIIESGSDTDAIAASRVLVKMMEDKTAATESAPHIDIKVLSVAEGMLKRGDVDPDDAARMLRASMQSNVDRVEELRSSRR